MGTFKDVEQAREYFTGDRFAAVNGMRIEALTDAESVCAMDVGPDHRNAMGRIMGGAIYTLADLAFAVAANQQHHPTVALEAKINYLNASAGEHLTARARCIKDGKSIAVFQVTVTDELGKDVALVIVTGYKL